MKQNIPAHIYSTQDFNTMTINFEDIRHLARQDWYSPNIWHVNSQNKTAFLLEKDFNQLIDKLNGIEQRVKVIKKILLDEMHGERYNWYGEKHE